MAIRNAWAAALVAVAISAGAADRAAAEASAAPPTVRAVEHMSSGTAVRLAFRLDAEPRYTLFTLDRPPRIVLDFPALGWSAPTPEPRTMPGIRAIRHGLFRPDRARIVIELERPMAVRSVRTTLAGRGGVDLVLDLSPVDPARFARTAGWPEGARWEAEPVPPIASDGRLVVAIDPGHGGIDPGASAYGLVEKDLVLGFAKRLAERVAAEPGLVPFLTRTDDRFVPLRGRLRLARDAGADVLVSVHADSLLSGEADGASVYTLSERGSDSATRAFAERENRADVIAGADLSGSGDDLTRVLITLARRGTEARSTALAQSLLDAMDGRLAVLETRPHRRGNFYVLKAPDLPSVLVELGFLSSEADRERMTDPDWQDRMADALTRGLAGWAEVAGSARAKQAQ